MKKIIETKTGGSAYNEQDVIPLLSVDNKYNSLDTFNLAVRMQDACFVYWGSKQANKTQSPINRIAFSVTPGGNVLFRPVFKHRRVNKAEITVPYSIETVPKSIAAWCDVAETMLQRLGYADGGIGYKHEV